ncbi:hypothetical protein [Notoacmeibacter ruber]|uniref:Uncharacterized protein n=1 Tax=Notoacmeibacter ruber TaxID=2670375 RepID=A0A3L7JEZ2_9HYPH|nr:hypothetical protein [Notoacmeibacter ruber]RLQ88889.1 hypothetical protein D8780_12300 [Notoacmeibacter ruber]
MSNRQVNTYVGRSYQLIRDASARVEDVSRSLAERCTAPCADPDGQLQLSVLTASSLLKQAASVLQENQPASATDQERVGSSEVMKRLLTAEEIIKEAWRDVARQRAGEPIRRDPAVTIADAIGELLAAQNIQSQRSK